MGMGEVKDLKLGKSIGRRRSSGEVDEIIVPLGSLFEQLDAF